MKTLQEGKVAMQHDETPCVMKCSNKQNMNLTSTLHGKQVWTAMKRCKEGQMPRCVIQ